MKEPVSRVTGRAGEDTRREGMRAPAAAPGCCAGGPVEDAGGGALALALLLPLLLLLLPLPGGADCRDTRLLVMRAISAPRSPISGKMPPAELDGLAGG